MRCDPQRMTLGQRVRKARLHKKLRQEDLSKLVGISQQTLSNLENDKNEGSVALAAIAIECGVSVAWLDREEGPMILEAGEEGWLNVPSYDQAAHLGDGADPAEYAETHKLKFRADSLERKGLRAHNLHVYYGKGDSMEPRIQNGDAILFNTAETAPVDGAIFVVRYDGGYFAKRLEKLGNQWFLVSDNKDDPKWRKPRLIDMTKDFEIIGRVRWIGSWEH